MPEYICIVFFFFHYFLSYTYTRTAYTELNGFSFSSSRHAYVLFDLVEENEGGHSLNSLFSVSFAFSYFPVIFIYFFFFGREKFTSHKTLDGSGT